ncbi:hypothetical protein Tco_1256084 [Tanacetum coccineum]
MRIDPIKTPKEPTYQVVLDALALTTCYPAFLITTGFSEIYMHQFWHTITKIKNSSSYKFKLDKKKCTTDVEELGYTGDIDSVTKVYTDHMHKLGEPLLQSSIDAFLGKPQKKAPSKAERSKGIELMSEAALLEEAQLKKAIKRSKRETNIHQAGGLNEGDGLEPEGDRDDDDQQSDDEKTESDNDKAADLSKTYDEEEVEFVHTPNNYVPTDNENVDDEEYDRINEEMYSDVNVKLKDAELEGEGKDDEEMADASYVDAEHENVDQEVTGDQVKDVAREIVTAALAT